MPLGVRLVLVFILYFLSAKLGLALGSVSHFAAFIWAPTGLAISAVYLGGYIYALAIFCAAATVNYSIGAPLGASIGIGIGNSLEAVVATYFLRDVFNIRPRLTGPKDVFYFIVFAALFSPIISATIGVLSLWIHNAVPNDVLALTWMTWWLGDIMGALIVGAAILVWATTPLQRPSGKQLVEYMAVVMSLWGILWFVLGSKETGTNAYYSYLIFPILMWMATRYFQVGAVATTLIISIVAIYQTYRGVGVYTSPVVAENLFQIQIFLAVVSVTGLAFGAIACQANKNLKQLRDSFETLDDKVRARTVELFEANKSLIEAERVLSENQKNLERRVAERTAELSRHQKRLEFLSETGRILNSSLEYETTLKAVAKMALSVLCEWCSIETIHPDGKLKSLTIANLDEKKAEIARDLREKYPPNLNSKEMSELLAGRPLLYELVNDEALRARTKNSEHYSILKKLNVNTVVLVPIVVGRRTVGLISLVGGNVVEKYGTEDIQLAQELALRAGVAIENATLYQKAQEAIRLRDEFLSIASHELKTPLTSLKLQLQIAQQKSLNISADKMAKIFETANRQVGRLTGLIEDLLDVSRIQAGRLAFNFEEANFVTLVQEVLDRLAGQLTQAKVDVKFEAHEPVYGFWDKTRIDQVIVNLLSNILKYAPGGPAEIKVLKILDSVQLVVSDSGPGIEPSKQSIIFERFERGSPKRGVSGLGLGLYIISEIVRGHRGHVDVSSEKGRGAKFTIRLPLDCREKKSPQESLINPA